MARLTMIVRDDFRTQAEAAVADEDAAAQDAFAVPLARTSDPSTVFAWGTSWDFDATGHSASQVKTFLQNRGVPVGDLAADGYWIDPNNRFALADGNRYPPRQVLNHLGLVRMDVGAL